MLAFINGNSLCHTHFSLERHYQSQYLVAIHSSFFHYLIIFTPVYWLSHFLSSSRLYILIHCLFSVFLSIQCTQFMNHNVMSVQNSSRIYIRQHDFPSIPRPKIRSLHLFRLFHSTLHFCHEISTESIVSHFYSPSFLFIIFPIRFVCSSRGGHPVGA